jgi:hypothetical protein
VQHRITPKALGLMPEQEARRRVVEPTMVERYQQLPTGAPILDRSVRGGTDPFRTLNATTGRHCSFQVCCAFARYVNGVDGFIDASHSLNLD